MKVAEMLDADPHILPEEHAKLLSRIHQKTSEAIELIRSFLCACADRLCRAGNARSLCGHPPHRVQSYYLVICHFVKRFQEINENHCSMYTYFSLDFILKQVYPIGEIKKRNKDLRGRV
ncbi:hypothetical protein [Paenibacillus sp. NRS-1781]|uniref:hypothetical protein n=1 Tax=Paenibacillus sp. NRS-1781 TaxID=3233905 RepID=UPI003D2E633A